MRRGWLAAVLGVTACAADPPRQEALTLGMTTMQSATSESETSNGGASTGVVDPSDETASPDGTSSTTASVGQDTEDPIFDVGGGIDVPREVCVECGLFIDSQQSGTFEIQGADVFATAELAGDIVYAIGDYGRGRFIATADSFLPFNEQTDCPLHTWLAGHEDPNPTILFFGWTPSDGPIGFTEPATMAGVHLPAQYIGDPAQLAADYDVVMYFEASNQFDALDEPTDAEMQTVLDFVADHGGGAYVSSEFATPTGAYLNQNDIDSVNRLLEPMGVQALVVTLPWGGVTGAIEFECFPAPAG